MSEQEQKPVVYFVLCAAPATQQAEEFIKLAQSDGWDVCVITTPHALKFVDVDALEALSNHPVRSDYKLPGEEDVLPDLDAMVVAPATFNTINKWALGIADNLALSQMQKAIGLQTPIPVVLAPCITSAYDKHPMFRKHLDVLRGCGVRVLYDPINYRAPKIVPWESILEELDRGMKNIPPGDEKFAPAGMIDVILSTFKAFMQGFRKNNQEQNTD